MASESTSARPFVGKVAIVTGSARGVGKGIVKGLASHGCSVVVNYANSAKAAEAVVAEIKEMGSEAIAIKADISKPDEVVELFDKAVAHYGRMDFVVSNAGMESWCPETEVKESLFDKVFNLNCKGQFFVAQQALKHCQPGGRLILTSSVAASLGGLHDHALYAGSKAAVEGFTRAFATDCGVKGITVNAIAPGGIDTDMFEQNAWRYAPGGFEGMPLDKIRAGIASVCPLKRVGTPNDVANFVLLLCDPKSEWLNGLVLRLSGGSAV